MRILSLDIETRPNIAYVWGLWDQNVGLNQIVESHDVLCFAARFLGEKKMYFADNRDYPAMVELAHQLLDEADAVMHWNGKSFDIKHLNTLFVKEGLAPPSPYEQIDLLSVVRSKFKFPSNKLEYVAQTLLGKGKVDNGGFELWIQCMAGDDTAWRKMQKYNVQDVKLLEDLYYILQPWITAHPSRSLYDSTKDCPICGADHSKIQSRGTRKTKVTEYRQYQCQSCGGWLRGGKKVSGIDIRQGAA